MDLDLAQLRALRAAVDAGTLEGAARDLHVTPSAISQRLKALEQATGRVLLVRSKPVQVTDPGRAVLRLAREMDLLVADTARELAGDADAPVVLPVAVNADSLSTWFLPALAPLRDEVLLDLHRADQDGTATLLRDGSVVAAVTAASRPVSGCTSTPLGVLRYRPAAVPGFAARWFPDGPTAAALAHAPVVDFDRDDDLQRGWLRRRTRGRATPPTHRVPSTEGFVQAILAGLGWGMLSDLQLAEPNLRSAVVLLDPDATVDVPLHWQRWKVRSPSLERLSEVVLAGARHSLRT
ncbi:LysR family transcriptional regulator ArgP [Acidimicrobiia bacterium EGI L10123]|uniref:LysR family transcriptional regulator ArgP n=1 Tax=Salinilacustrithrix flava TaxID=2957203 RepID=UPI003D7C2FB7|nr:LysR family transcriptional regulator ArgP [Acidimicrobiia bacterium EGI L10123]